MEETPTAARPRLLVVDDSLLIQRMIRDSFEPAGFEVLVAGNGQEGLDAARERRPQVIIADIIMPVMDGWEFCQQVRTDPTLADVPFLFLTAVREVPKRVRGLRMGADDYITKPFSKEELLARVEIALAKTRRLSALKAAGNAVLSGHTSHLSISDLLQVLTLNGKSGALRITESGGMMARIHFNEGRIIQADTEGVEGRKALFRILEWEDARFEMDPRGEAPERRGIRDSTSSVLMDGFAQNDELRRLRGRLPSGDTRFRAAFDPGDPKVRGSLETREQAILMEFRDVVTLQEVLDASPLEDLEIGRSVLRLMELGLVQPVEPGVDA